MLIVLEGRIETDGLESAPRELQSFAMIHPLSWTRWNNFLRNNVYFDSRTSEWRSFLGHLCSSAVREAQVCISIYPGGPANLEEHTPTHMEACWSHDITAVDIIARSQLCVDVNFKTMMQLIARMQSVKEAVPFVLDVLANPPPRSLEARSAKGYYIRSVEICLKDLIVGVDVYRAGKKGDPTH
jgi:hypothetical protein